MASARAGVFTDDLSRCLVQKTSADDKVGLVKWMFTAAALHPAVESVAKITAEDVDAANKQVAELFMKLLATDCKEQAAQAVKNEGQMAIQTSFSVLGQVAAQELFSSPPVAAAMAGLERHVDKERLQAVFAPAQ